MRGRDMHRNEPDLYGRSCTDVDYNDDSYDYKTGGSKYQEQRAGDAGNRGWDQCRGCPSRCREGAVDVCVDGILNFRVPVPESPLCEGGVAAGALTVDPYTNICCNRCGIQAQPAVILDQVDDRDIILISTDYFDAKPLTSRWEPD
ncbi:unnamed protein product (mitochondrion) [Plasmodiophora brassicae]|uniref:Uncharacterized protein n=1 Tax=Plasmodiophora brassicae TaxID=37360 RepID=A0A3P3YGW7_PLABS|nr:unnamed protein product [Plasmodiophora brassicae]